MKIGLYRGPCSTLPKELTEAMKGLTLPYQRLELGKFLLKNGELIYEDGDNAVFKYNGSYFNIVNVIKDRRWTIEEYDSYEYIKYVDVMLLDEASGYSEWLYDESGRKVG